MFRRSAARAGLRSSRLKPSLARFVAVWVAGGGRLLCGMEPGLREEVRSTEQFLEEPWDWGQEREEKLGVGIPVGVPRTPLLWKELEQTPGSTSLVRGPSEEARVVMVSLLNWNIPASKPCSALGQDPFG